MRPDHISTANACTPAAPPHPPPRCLLLPSPPPKTGLSWSDVLLGPLPNVYLYAANNPSESIIAKRRGYGTIVSHNVPPYGRAGRRGISTHMCGLYNLQYRLEAIIYHILQHDAAGA
jgi:hypothetical protein